MNVYIFTPGTSTMPPVEGGGIENLLQELVEQNEIEHKVEIILWSVYNKEAEKQSKIFRHTTYKYYHNYKWINILDTLTWVIAHRLFHSSNIAFRNIWRRIYVILSARKTIKDICHREKAILIIESSVTFLHSISGIKKGKCKIYFHAHNSTVYNHPKLESVIEKLDGVISVSNFLKKDNYQLLGRCPRQYILPNCIDLSVFCNKKVVDIKQKEYIRKFNSDGKKILLFVGRLIPEKGVLEVIQAFRKLGKEDVRLLIVGGVFYSKGIHSRFESRLLKEAEGLDILFAGYVDFKDMPYLYQMSDVSVLPSKWKEPAGLVVIESMACGIPVITTRRGGIPEYAKDGVSYVRTDKHMVEDIVEAINRILEYDKQEKDIIKCRMKEISKGYSRSDYLKKFIEIIFS